MVPFEIYGKALNHDMIYLSAQIHELIVRWMAVDHVTNRSELALKTSTHFQTQYTRSEGTRPTLR